MKFCINVYDDSIKKCVFYFIDKLDIVKKTTERNAIGIKTSTYIEYDVEHNDNDLNLKLAIMWEYPNIRTLFF